MHSILECALNTRVCVQYWGVHSILGCAFNTRVCARLNDLRPQLMNIFYLAYYCKIPKNGKRLLNNHKIHYFSFQDIV